MKWLKGYPPLYLRIAKNIVLKFPKLLVLSNTWLNIEEKAIQLFWVVATKKRKMDIYCYKQSFLTFKSLFQVNGKIRLYLISLLTLVTLLFSHSSSFAEEECEQNSFCVGTGKEDGAYYAFVEDYKKISSQNNIVIKPTGGSKKILEELKNGNFDAGIVQNDTAYNAYYHSGIDNEPNQSFATALPLFPEYFQIIIKSDSGIHHIDDLRNKRIILGKDGSGSINNAKDVFRAAEITYTEIEDIKEGEAVRKLRGGGADAICYTGASVPAYLGGGINSEFRILSLPGNLIEKLTEKYPYYHRDSLERENKDSINTISLMAYLVFSNDADPKATEDFMTLLLGNWEDLKGKDKKYQLIGIPKDSSSPKFQEAIQRKPTPLHPIANKVLVDNEFIHDPFYVTKFLLSIIVGFIVMTFISHKWTYEYDRLGNLETAKGLWRYRLMLIGQSLGVFVATCAGVALIYFAIIMAIQHFEVRYATDHGIYNPFATMTIPDAALWLWGWIGGHEGNIFPKSTEGKILVIFPTFVGIFSIVYMGFRYWRDIVARKVAEQKGTFVLPIKDHVLICGWNEMAPGIITGLTTPSAPEQKNVVVIAEMDDEKPLEKYNFLKGCVYYYRGDSSDHNALKNSHAQKASAALILAGDKKAKTNNIGSVLTTLAIKKLKNEDKKTHNIFRLIISRIQKLLFGDQQEVDIFTVAELRYKENIKNFEACNIDALVHAETIIFRLAAQACINKNAISLIFDMITHDEHSALYAMPVSTIYDHNFSRVFRKVSANKRFGYFSNESRRFFVRTVLSRFGQQSWLLSEQTTPTELRTILARKGISLIAVDHRKKPTNISAMVEPTFSDDRYTNFSSYTSLEPLKPDDILIYSALEKEDIYSAMKGDVSKITTKTTKTTKTNRPHHSGFVKKPNQVHRILLIGNVEKCCRVIEQLQGNDKFDYRVLTDCPFDKEISCSENIIMIPDLLDFEKLNKHLKDQLDTVIILGGTTCDTDAYSDSNYGELDARTLLIAQYISSNITIDDKPQIIAEMVGRSTRELFKNAGVDMVLPSNLIVERFMIKMAFGLGSVSNYLIATLALNNDVHLDSITLDEHDKAWQNLKYEELLLCMPERLQLLAIHPKDDEIRKKLVNKLQDFGRHYIANPEQADDHNYVSKPGDVLLVLKNEGKNV